MAQPTVDNAQGTVLTFTTTSWSAEINSIEHSGVKRTEIDTTHLASTSMTNMPGDLVDEGEYKIEFHFNPDNPPPFTSTAEIVQIQFPLSGTITTGSRDKTSMWFKEYSAKFETEQKMSATATLRCTGARSHTNAA